MVITRVASGQKRKKKKGKKRRKYASRVVCRVRLHAKFNVRRFFRGKNRNASSQVGICVSPPYRAARIFKAEHRESPGHLSRRVNSLLLKSWFSPRLGTIFSPFLQSRTVGTFSCECAKEPSCKLRENSFSIADSNENVDEKFDESRDERWRASGKLDRRGASRKRRMEEGEGGREQRSISSTLWFARSRDKIRGPEKKIIIPLHWYDKYKQAGPGRGLHYSPLKRALNQPGCLRNSRKRGRAVTFVSKITAGRSAAMNLFDESRTSRGAARARGKNSELNTCQKVPRY